ncbi:hypothetical protein PG990_003849 [Apiospora arundinis]
MSFSQKRFSSRIFSRKKRAHLAQPSNATAPNITTLSTPSPSREAMSHYWYSALLPDWVMSFLKVVPPNDQGLLSETILTD